MKVHVENTLGLKGKEDLELDSSQTVQEVIEVIAANNLIAPDSITLTHEGKELQRDRSLKSLGVKEGATLRTIPRDARGGQGSPPLLSPLLRTRLAAERARIQAARIELQPFSPLIWVGRIPGAGPWKNKSFRFQLLVPDEYPYKPPAFQFIDKPSPAHPNIGQGGYVCLNHLKDAWSPSMNFQTVYEDVIWLFDHPNWDSVLNLDARPQRFVEPGWIESLKRAIMGA